MPARAKLGSMRHIRRATTVALGPIAGLTLAWAGGYILSSQPDRCTLGSAECTGPFSSEAWHVVGAALVVLGFAIALMAIFLVTVRRRSL